MGAQASQASNRVDDTAIKEGRASFGSDPLGLKGSMGCCAARSKPSKDYPAHRGGIPATRVGYTPLYTGLPVSGDPWQPISFQRHPTSLVQVARNDPPKKVPKTQFV